MLARNVGLLHDISARRQAQEVVDPSNASLRALLHTKAPPKTPLVPLRAAVGPPTNDLDDFKVL